MNKFIKMVLVGMVLVGAYIWNENSKEAYLSEYNQWIAKRDGREAPEDFTIGKLEIADTLTLDTHLFDYLRDNGLPSGFFGYELSDINYNSVRHPWKLKHGQQIKFSAPKEFYTVMEELKVNPTVGSCWSIVCGVTTKYRIHYSASDNVYMEKGALVVWGRWPGTASVCASISPATYPYNAIPITVSTDVEVNGVTKSRREEVCSLFEVVP